MRSIVISKSFCLFVCLSACISQKPHGRSTTASVPTQCLCMLPVAVAWSSSDGLAIYYVLPVLRMTHNGSVRHKRRESITAETTASIPTKFCSRVMISKYRSWVVHRERSLLSTNTVPCSSSRDVNAPLVYRMKP